MGNISAKSPQLAVAFWWNAIDSPLGPLYMAATARGLCRISIGGDERAFLARLESFSNAGRDPQQLALAADQLRAYFENPSFAFDLPLDLAGVTPFQHRVLMAACAIPAGTVWTYRRLAETVGNPKASRAVGQAMAHNPVPIVVPCHRVVGSDGSLTGYGGGEGVATKRWLLRLEGALEAVEA
jgi:O-6-methylguanine DNA methyltransferase